MTTANREYEALTTVEAVQKAFADGRSVEVRSQAMGDWWPAGRATDLLLRCELANGVQFRAPAASVGDAPPEGAALEWVRRAYRGEGPYTIYNMEVAYLAGWQARAALGVGDAPSDAVACDTCEGNGRVRGEIRCEDDDGSQDCGDCNGTGTIGTAPPAAPVVSNNTPEARMFASACEALASIAEALGLDEHADPDDMLTAIQEGRGPSGSEAYQSLLSAVHEAGFRVVVDDGGTFIVEDEDALLVPATDDKAPAVDAGHVLMPRVPTQAIRSAMYMAQHFDMSVQNPDEWGAVDKAYAAAIKAGETGKYDPLAAPTSPHDVDAEPARKRCEDCHEPKATLCETCAEMRHTNGPHDVDAVRGLPKKWREDAHELATRSDSRASECGEASGMERCADELTAALRKPGGQP